jgi:CARDB
MNNKLLNTVAAAFITGLSFSGSLSADTSDFIGEWVNVDFDTRGITRFVLSPTADNDILKIEVFGKCHPTDCEWGDTSLSLYGANVSDSDYQFASARYEKGFADTIITMEFLDDGRIALDNFTEFLEDNRENYHSFDLFRKAEKEVSLCPDLIIEEIMHPEYVYRVGSRIEAVVKNIGTSNAGISLARLVDSSTLQKTGAPYNSVARVPELAPGETYTVKFSLPYWVYNPDAQFSVTADYKKMVKECNEKNNTKDFFGLG